MDTQVIEIIGRNRLVNELLEAGLEVAVPARDRGVDLIAYLDLAETAAPGTATGSKAFSAKPIQMKAASRRSFSISRKYAKIRDLILAFVWNLEDPREAVTYALTYDEAVAIGDGMGWTSTASWLERDEYSNTRPGAVLISKLEPFRMTPERWRGLIAGMQRCPICMAPVPESSRYPRQLCQSCVSRARSADRRPLEFSSVDVSGGFVARYADSGEDYPSGDCFVDGVQCRAGEAKFGGIVVQVVE